MGPMSIFERELQIQDIAILTAVACEGMSGMRRTSPLPSDQLPRLLSQRYPNLGFSANMDYAFAERGLIGFHVARLRGLGLLSEVNGIDGAPAFVVTGWGLAALTKVKEIAKTFMHELSGVVI